MCATDLVLSVAVAGLARGYARVGSKDRKKKQTPRTRLDSAQRSDQLSDQISLAIISSDHLE